MPTEADLLPDVPGLPEPEHPQPGHGEGGVGGALPLQVRLHGLLPDPAPQPEAGARGRVRVPALRLPLPGGVLQVAGLTGGRDAPPDARPQEHHHPAGRGHRLPGHGHQPAGGGGLGHDAVLLRPPLHAGAGEAGEVRGPPAVLRHRAAHRHAQAGRELRLPPGAQRPPPPAHLGGHAPVHPRRRGGRHHEQRLPGLRHGHRPPLRRQRQPGHQRHHLHVLPLRRARAGEGPGRGGGAEPRPAALFVFYVRFFMMFRRDWGWGRGESRVSRPASPVVNICRFVYLTSVALVSPFFYCK